MLSLLDSNSGPWGHLCVLHATVFFVRYRLDDAQDGFIVYTLGGFILVPPMGRIKDLKIKLIELRS